MERARAQAARDAEDRRHRTVSMSSAPADATSKPPLATSNQRRFAPIRRSRPAPAEVHRPGDRESAAQPRHRVKQHRTAEPRDRDQRDRTEHHPGDHLRRRIWPRGTGLHREQVVGPWRGGADQHRQARREQHIERHARDLRPAAGREGAIFGRESRPCDLSCRSTPCARSPSSTSTAGCGAPRASSGSRTRR